MKLHTYQLDSNNNSNATVTVYLHNITEGLGEKIRPLILVIPGGGYSFVSEREAEPVAMAFYQAGYHAAILRYSCNEAARDLQPQLEAFQAIRLLREHAAEWRIVPDKIAVCGFSAGGHLAASCGTMWNEPLLQKRLGMSGEEYKPNAMILSYPVITSGEFAHRGSMYNLSSSEADDSEARFFSLEHRVTSDTPPTFIWHTEDDASVPVENALLLISALRRHKVSFECHIFNQGQHGLSLCNDEVNTPHPHAAHWFKLCLEWLEALEFNIVKC